MDLSMVWWVLVHFGKLSNYKYNFSSWEVLFFFFRNGSALRSLLKYLVRLAGRSNPQNKHPSNFSWIRVSMHKSYLLTRSLSQGNICRSLSLVSKVNFQISPKLQRSMERERKRIHKTEHRAPPVSGTRVLRDAVSIWELKCTCIGRLNTQTQEPKT